MGIPVIGHSSRLRVHAIRLIGVCGILGVCGIFFSGPGIVSQSGRLFQSAEQKTMCLLTLPQAKIPSTEATLADSSLRSISPSNQEELSGDSSTVDHATVDHPQPLSDYTFTQIHMAMPVRISVWAQHKKLAHQAGRTAFLRISELVQKLSHFVPESELNSLAGNEEIPISNYTRRVSPDLMNVLSYSYEVYDCTDGVWDPTAGPIINLWKQAKKTNSLPSQGEIESALNRVGFDQMKIDEKNGTVLVLRTGIQLDLGAVAKGYIVDQALQVLKKHGIHSACIEAGGDFVVSQAPPGTTGWKIDVPHLGSMRLANCGVSISGDTVQYAEIDSIRYSHVVNARTGMPLTNRMMAVVTAPLAIQSDALATAACILKKPALKDTVRDITGVRIWRWQIGTKPIEISTTTDISKPNGISTPNEVSTK